MGTYVRNTGPAVQALKQYAAERAADDPVKLARAIRIVRVALVRNHVTVDDLLPASEAA